jgi:hypothetical protein
MPLNVWTQQSGTSLGSFPQEEPVDIPLPLIPTAAFNGVPPPNFDGTGHHPTAPLRNSAGSPFARSSVNSYVDGIHQMRTDLPNARTVSNLVVRDPVNHGNEADPNGYSGFMYAFGQFITHDLEFARPGTGNIDIIVPAGDVDGFTAGSHIPVTRNAVAPNTGTDIQHPALPMNDVTGWIDASVVYGVAYPPGVPQGPTPFQNPVNLREGGQIATTGKLLTSSNGQYGPIVGGSFLFGDPRGTENPDLTSVQTLFIREHNWHVTRLKTLHPLWSGEQLYQRARSIVIAELQNITFKEWLPKVVGADNIPAYNGFKPNVDGTIKVEFAAAAMRFGHSIVSGAQDRVDEAGNITESLTLAQAFFLTPDQYERNGGADGFLRKLASDVSNKLDVHIIDDLRNLLNDPPAAMDLAATNIQRGRDLGLPSLNQMRTVLGLNPYTTFAQISSDGALVTALQTAYTNVNDIDLWIGGLSEDPVVGAMVGETFQAIIIDQMIRVRDGDQQWFENLPWSSSDLAWLQASTLSDMILRNTDTVHMQADAFIAVERADLIAGNVNSITARTTSVTASADTFGLGLRVISGELPPGLHLKGPRLQGNPYIVANNTIFNFCIRANQGSSISDRAFLITITGQNFPRFLTTEGYLPLGSGQQLYVLDETFVSYQLEAFDLNTAVGQTLTYFIASDDGALPAGITLSPSGLLSGFIQPTVKITPKDGNGTYDDAYYDAVAFDFGKTPTDGYDSYQYDDVFFDFNRSMAPPTTLNVNYQFRVTVTDGVNYALRIYKIFVVGTDQFRADNTSFNGVADGFSSDATYLRAPVWITNTNLGTFRANNYLTIPVALYDTLDVLFRLETTNEEVYAVTYKVSNTDNSIGLLFTGDIVANSTTISNISNTGSLVVGQYVTGTNIADGTIITDKTISTLTISKGALGTSFGATLLCGGNQVTVGNVKGTLAVGQHLTFNNYLEGATEIIYEIIKVDTLVNHQYRLTLNKILELPVPNGTPFYIGTLSQLPNGLSFDVGTGDIYGQLPYQPAITTNYKFTITATRLGDNVREYLNSSRTFTMSVVGDVDSVVSWNTPGDLGTIPANYISTLSVSASTTIPDAVMLYQLESGRLPPGLTLNIDGEIIGTTRQYFDPATRNLGLTSFDGGNLTFDVGTTTTDRIFKFTVLAKDQFNYSAVTREFTVTVNTPNTVAYSNIITRPYLKSDQRNLWKSFINDSSIFPPTSIYRTNDVNFGLQTDLKMLVYAGIQTQDAAAYVGAMGLNHKKKRFQFGSLKKATAVDPNTGNAVYEVVYMQMLDPTESNGKSRPQSITYRPGTESDTITADNSINYWTVDSANLAIDAPDNRRDVPTITIDSTGYEISNTNPDTYFPNSISNWQKRLGSIGLSERNYLPLWMRSTLTGSKEQLGYTLSVPVCFCKPGTADTILLNIKFSGFDFKNLDYTVDRFIIDSVTGYLGDKYLVFKNDRITV